MPTRTQATRARLGGYSRRSIVALAIALMTLTVASACASSHVRRDADQPIVLHLTNDLAPPSDVSVYAITQDGTRRLVGIVPPNKDRVLKVPSDISPGTSFRMVAERTGGRPIVSQPVSSTSSLSMIDWDLQSNAMWFPESGE